MMEPIIKSNLKLRLLRSEPTSLISKNQNNENERCCEIKCVSAAAIAYDV